MKKRIICLAATMMILSACNANETASETEKVSEVSETTTAPVTTETEAVTTKAPKPISPLSSSKKQAYFQNEDFSVTAELKNLQSSLYYPDIVAEMDANPELFVLETAVKVKNLAYEDRSFDCSELSLLSGGGGLYLFDTECEDAENIPSGKSVTMKVRFLCTISQADEISGMTWGGRKFENAEKFIPDSFADVITKQSADDVKNYLYRPYVIHCKEGYYLLSASDPAGIEVFTAGRAGENNEYYAVKYMVYNRSDYALLIEPDAFDFCYLPDNADQMVEAEKAYIIADEKLMYQPKKADKKIKGMSKACEIPDFLCMEPEGCTEFTIIYKAPGHINRWMMLHNGSHDEPYYCKYESIIALDCDID